MIKKIDRIILVGTSHVAKDETKKIEQTIEKYMPDVVCLELDTQRLKKVLAPKDEKTKQKPQTYQAIKELGAFGFLFAQLAGYVQKKVGKSVKIDPGVDMKTAYNKARELKIPVSLIDIDIRITLKKLSKLSFIKKISLVSSLFFKSFKKEYRKLLNFDLKKLPEEKMITQMIQILKKETPSLYKILIDDRNKHMSQRLLKLKEEHSGYIMAFVGAGHLEGMETIIKKQIEENSTDHITFSFMLEEENNNNNLNLG
jgi:pheromone shutdown-related protein TraB